MRVLKSADLTVSGVVAMALLLAVSGLMVYTLAWGVPGTWTPTKEKEDGWWRLGIKVASVRARVSGRYDSTGYKFDMVSHYGDRWWASGLSSEYLYVEFLTDSYEIIRSLPGGTAMSYSATRSGSFTKASTYCEAKIVDGFGTIEILDAYVIIRP